MERSEFSGWSSYSSSSRSTSYKRTRVIPREDNDKKVEIVNKGSSEAWNINISEIERDINYLKANKDILVTHANTDLRNTLNRVISRAGTLYGTESYKDFYTRIRNIFDQPFIPRIGSIGALFRGYDLYKGDENIKKIAPTVIDSILPPDSIKIQQPKESSVILQRNSNGSQIYVYRKGNNYCHLFLVSSSEILPVELTESEKKFLLLEGIDHYKIIHYNKGIYYCNDENFQILLSEKSSEKIINPLESKHYSSHSSDSNSSIKLIFSPILIIIVLVILALLIRK